MGLLITLNEQQAIKPISANWSKATKSIEGKTNYEQLSEEIEETKLSNYLGNDLLQDLQYNQSTDNDLLLNGGQYLYNGKTKYFKGVKYILAYMIYREYIRVSILTDTATGMVKKTRTESEFLQAGELKAEQLLCEEIILKNFKQIEFFLNAKKGNYTSWNCTTQPRVYNPSFRAFRKTKN